jgi:hypothetical protein
LNLRPPNSQGSPGSCSTAAQLDGSRVVGWREVPFLRAPNACLCLVLPGAELLDRVRAGVVVDRLAVRLARPNSVRFVATLLGSHVGLVACSAWPCGGDVGCASDVHALSPVRVRPLVGRRQRGNEHWYPTRLASRSFVA